MLIVLDSCLTESNWIETMEIVSLSVVMQIAEFNSHSSKVLVSFIIINIKSRPFWWSNSTQKFSLNSEIFRYKQAETSKRFHS